MAAEAKIAPQVTLVMLSSYRATIIWPLVGKLMVSSEPSGFHLRMPKSNVKTFTLPGAIQSGYPNSSTLFK